MSNLKTRVTKLEDARSSDPLLVFVKNEDGTYSNAERTLTREELDALAEKSEGPIIILDC